MAARSSLAYRLVGEICEAALAEACHAQTVEVYRMTAKLKKELRTRLIGQDGQPKSFNGWNPYRKQHF